MIDNKYKCPECGKTIIENNIENQNNLIIKSRLVFLNENGEILCRCLDCKSIVNLPLNFMKSSQAIQQKV